MIDLSNLFAAPALARDLQLSTEKDIARMQKREHTPSYLLKIKLEEAAKFEELVSSLKVINQPEFIRLQIYAPLDTSLRSLTKTYPDLKGYHIIIGPDNPSFMSHFFRFTPGIPYSFYKT
jgi:hypothetical protein